MASPAVAITLNAFSFPLAIGGKTIDVQVPAGVTGTFVMPQIAFTADSSVTADSSEEIPA